MQNFLPGLASVSDDDVQLNHQPSTIYRQGEWVNGRYDGQCHTCAVLNVNNNEKIVHVRCIKVQNDSWWKLEPEIDAVWYPDCSWTIRI